MPVPALEKKSLSGPQGEVTARYSRSLSHQNPVSGSLQIYNIWRRRLFYETHLSLVHTATRLSMMSLWVELWLGDTLLVRIRSSSADKHCILSVLTLERN